MKKRIWKKGAAAAALAMGLLAAAPSMAAFARTVPEGLYAGEESLGGMSEEEAAAAVSAYAEGLKARQVVLDVNGSKVEAGAGELGLYWANPDVLKETLDSFEYGSLVQQYMARADLAHAPESLDMDMQLDTAAAAALIGERCQGLTAQAQDAAITRQNGQFTVTEGTTGVAVDTEATAAAVLEALKEEGTEPVQVAAAVTVQEPRIKAEDLRTIQDVLGTFTTSFASSGAARSTNLTVGAGKINGRVLMPGETLSGYECLQPFTTENGYKAAAAYENGQVVDSIGGGVCQISTTLYNAALNAELEIAQRQNHSMIVTYVPPSQDAAIAGTYKDLKITNNYSTPIYVEGYTQGKQITFTIYGKETRPANRKVEYVSETLGTTDPGEPQMIVDNSLAPGAKVKVQSSHTGRRSRLWKVVYVDGAETERTLLHTDTYNASKAIYRVGPTPVAAPAQTAAPAPAPETQAPAETTAPQPVEGVAGGPGVTAAPETQAAPAETPAAAPAPQAAAPAPGPTAAPAVPESQPAGPGEVQA